MVSNCGNDPSSSDGAESVSRIEPDSRTDSSELTRASASPGQFTSVDGGGAPHRRTRGVRARSNHHSDRRHHFAIRRQSAGHEVNPP